MQGPAANVTLDAASGKTSTVDPASSDTTASAGSDYTAISATTLTLQLTNISNHLCNYFRRCFR